MADCLSMFNSSPFRHPLNDKGFLKRHIFSRTEKDKVKTIQQENVRSWNSDNDLVDLRKLNPKLEEGKSIKQYSSYSGINPQSVIIWKDKLPLEVVIKMGLKTGGVF